MPYYVDSADRFLKECFFLFFPPSALSMFKIVAPFLARHGVSPVIFAVRHVDHYRGVVGQKLVANLVQDLQK